MEKQKNETNKKPIKTWSRKSTIIPDFVGFSFLIYNGKKFIPITVSEDMVGHKFGEFAPTRQFFGHTPADKKAKVEGGNKEVTLKIKQIFVFPFYNNFSSTSCLRIPTIYGSKIFFKESFTNK